MSQQEDRGRELETLKRRLADIADAFGADPSDQRDLCVKAREAGAKLEVREREIRQLALDLQSAEARASGYRIERDDALALALKLQGHMEQGAQP